MNQKDKVTELRKYKTKYSLILIGLKGKQHGHY